MTISSWQDFLSVFSIGLGCGFVIGFSCLVVRRIRITFNDSFRRAMMS